ncbi:hypothetical protein ACF082_37805 [Streptomyces lydicus]|uniref:hypothetical protein n=1 Tax=Streptomyces lydicus TaxID=47763 RepID=UPI0036FA64B4
MGSIRWPGIAFTDELPTDRGRHGELLSRGRRPAPPGQRGEPQYGSVLLTRQRRATRPEKLLCQVLGGPADNDERGWLWLLPDTSKGKYEGWPEREVTVHPPVSLAGMARALKDCPEMASHHTAVRVREPRLHGAVGALCRRNVAQPASPYPVVVQKKAVVRYDDHEKLPWVLASQTALYLTGCTIVGIHAELAAAGKL